MKLETKRKIRHWVCKRLGVEETVPYPVVKTIVPPVETLGAVGFLEKHLPRGDMEQIEENMMKQRLAYDLAEASNTSPRFTKKRINARGAAEK